MNIKSVAFLISASAPSAFPQSPAPVFAFAGKSNAGKSSFINTLTNVKGLAKVSKEPGRTRLINFFSVNGGEFLFADLPGYGYSRVSDEEKINWSSLIEAFLSKSENLKRVFLLLDVRRDPSADDKLLINYFYRYQIPFTVVASKADKISKEEGKRRVSEIARRLSLVRDDIILASSLNKAGRDEVLVLINNIILSDSGSIN
jgi:ribosome biogenesis GTP-binding protein YsxC/EngB